MNMEVKSLETFLRNCKKIAMEHLEFINQLSKIGVSLRGTTIGGSKRVEIVRPFLGEKEAIIKDGFELRWEKSNCFGDPLKELIKIVIDMGTWKHSWHDKIEPENYDKFSEIIQEKIVERAKEIELLFDVYFQLKHELSTKEHLKTKSDGFIIEPSMDTKNFNLKPKGWKL